jgi:hypothetical protein
MSLDSAEVGMERPMEEYGEIMRDWTGMLWVLVPVTAIICGVVYSMARLRWGADRGHDNWAAAERAAATQQELASTLAGIERRLDGIERALGQVD